jgi:transcriptional antiterminator NusG
MKVSVMAADERDDETAGAGEEPSAREDHSDETPPEEDPQPTSDLEPEPAADHAAEATQPTNKRWYVVKVQSGREDSIKEAIERRVKIEGLEEFFGQIVMPVERVTEIVKGKRVTRTRKLYPGYLMVEVEFNDKILYLFRETPGVGDFVGASATQAPTPMPEHEVQRMLGQRKEVIDTVAPTPKIKFERGDHVKIKEGTFAGMEGDVNEIQEAKGVVKVMLKIFGRDVPVELEYWQVEHA